MNLVQECAAAHGDLGTQEFVVEQCDHRAAQQEVLLHLILRRPRHNGLVRQNILAGDRRYTFNSPEVLSTCQRLTRGRLSRLPLAGESITGVNSLGSQSRTTFASDLLPHDSMTNPNRCATAGSFSTSSTRS